MILCDFKDSVQRKISDLPLNKRYAKIDAVVEALRPGFIETGHLLFKRAFPSKKGRFLKAEWAWPQKIQTPTSLPLRRNEPVTEIAGSAPASSDRR